MRFLLCLYTYIYVYVYIFIIIWLCAYAYDDIYINICLLFRASRFIIFACDCFFDAPAFIGHTASRIRRPGGSRAVDI